MKKLSRRLFLKNAGIISTIAISVNDVFGQTQKKHPDLRVECRTFLDRLSSKCHRIDQLQDPELAEQFQLSLKSWQNTGYELITKNYYALENEQLILIPLIISHSSLSVLDTGMVCIEKDELGKWQRLRPLSGFDIHALNVAAEALQNTKPNVDLVANLLPKYLKSPCKPEYYNTQNGGVKIKTNIDSDHIRTLIEIEDNTRVIFQKMIVFEKMLSKQPL